MESGHESRHARPRGARADAGTGTGASDLPDHAASPDAVRGDGPGASPAAHDPFRYEANAWLLIVGRLVPASTFFIGVWLGFLPEGFIRLGIGDSTFGILELILLIRLRREAAAMAPVSSAVPA